MEMGLISDTVTTAASHTLNFSKLNFSTISSVRTIPKKFTPKRRRMKRKSKTGSDDPDNNEINFVNIDSNLYFGGGFVNINGGGYFGGFGSGGGGGGGGGGGDGSMGWSFNWDESGSNSYSDPAFDFVYEVLSWIVLSNCLHFAYKKVVRLVGEGFGDGAREKVPIGMASVC